MLLSYLSKIIDQSKHVSSSQKRVRRVVDPKWWLDPPCSDVDDGPYRSSGGYVSPPPPGLVALAGACALDVSPVVRSPPRGLGRHFSFFHSTV